MKPITTLPWELLPGARSNLAHIEAGDAGFHAAVCSIPKKRMADAEYIVHVANSYPIAIAALREIAHAPEYDGSLCEDADCPNCYASSILKEIGE